ncbi:hypothetical protein M9H77_26757 [Catharanthus roseus]|uniref:Uncharacterized protein n=1 Tax=Catharanthus roseus TaxID=4058 RepID=A0ACC0ABF9_CATRO|nr:hypothetical protein M9H77_26757 [Catharanthus roseus]
MEKRKMTTIKPLDCLLGDDGTSKSDALQLTPSNAHEHEQREDNIKGKEWIQVELSVQGQSISPYTTLKKVLNLWVQATPLSKNKSGKSFKVMWNNVTCWLEILVVCFLHGELWKWKWIREKKMRRTAEEEDEEILRFSWPIRGEERREKGRRR